MSEVVEVIEVTVTATDLYLASIRDELRHWFLAYGTLGWINHIFGIWMWWMLVRGRTPLWPSRKIKHPHLAMFVGYASILALGGIIGRQAAQLSNVEMRFIAIGSGLMAAPTQGYLLGIMNRMVAFRKAQQSKKKGNPADHDQASEEAQEEEKNTQTQAEPGVERKSTDSSSDTTVPVEDTTEKTGFLEDFTNENPGDPPAETKTSDENHNEEDSEANSAQKAPKRKLSKGQEIQCLVFVITLMSGPMLMFAGCCIMAQKVLPKHGEEYIREQREVRDVLVGMAIFQGIVWLAGTVMLLDLSLNAKKYAKQERGKPMTKRRFRISAMKTFFVKHPTIPSCVTTGFAVLWCQYFLLAAVAGDTHGTATLGQFDNLRLVYLVLSKVLLFAF